MTDIQAQLQVPRPEAQLQVPRHSEDERRLRTIVGDLFQHGERLLKAEVELGIDEIHRRVDEGKLALQRAVVITGLFYASYLTLLAALVLGLSTVVPAWAGALMVGLASAAAGYVMQQRAKQPHQEIEQQPSTTFSTTSPTRAH